MQSKSHRVPVHFKFALATMPHGLQAVRSQPTPALGSTHNPPHFFSFGAQLVVPPVPAVAPVPGAPPLTAPALPPTPPLAAPAWEPAPLVPPAPPLTLMPPLPGKSVLPPSTAAPALPAAPTPAVPSVGPMPSPVAQPMKHRLVNVAERYLMRITPAAA